MQGIRTSRGCTSCKRRRKGCDLRTPACGRCLHLGVTCSYPARTLVFVEETGSASQRTSRTSTPRSTGSPPALSSTSQRSLGRTDLELQTDAAFWQIYLPHEDPALDGSIGGVLAAPWISTVRIIAEQDSYLRTALQSCAFAGLGWMQDDQMLVEHGLRLYTQALRETNTALQDPIRAQSDVVLACCRVLSLFEMFRRSPASAAVGQSQGASWQSHVEGTCRMLQLRGPGKHLEGHGLALYDAVRMSAVIFGLSRRKPNAFTNLSWHVVPRQTLRDDLYELASTIPGVLEQVDIYSAAVTRMSNVVDSDQTFQRGVDLVKHCIATGTQLLEWEGKALCLCEVDDPALANRANVASTSFVERNNRRLLDVSRSHGYGFFSICAQYWTVCIQLYGSCRLLCRRLSEALNTTLCDQSMPFLPQWMDAEPHALDIAQSASYFFRPGAGLWSASSAVFPVGTALVYFARTNRCESAPYKMMTDAFMDNKAAVVLRDFLQHVQSAQRKSGG